MVFLMKKYTIYGGFFIDPKALPFLLTAKVTATMVLM
jgi:hypothetical protein